MKIHGFFIIWGVICTLPTAHPADTIDLGSRRELFVDHHLVDTLDRARLVSHRPHDAGIVVRFDRPWEGRFCGYSTVIRDGATYRLYYRGHPDGGADGDEGEVTCYAESADGIHWEKPELGLFEVNGTTKNNVILARAAPVTHNFCPFLDANPRAEGGQRFRALGGIARSGLVAWTSPDGIHWTRLRERPVIDREMVPFPHMFDSQNVSFWSTTEKKYLCYFRVFKNGIRRICRTTSADFLEWSKPVLMEYRRPGRDVPIEHLYTSQTHPYFRAPHIYVAVAARFMPGRQVITAAEARAINVDPGYFRDTSDAVLMTTRGDSHYDRTFMSSFIRGGLGARNWVSRTTYPALNIVETGPQEMSIYVNQDYAQPTAHLRRYSLRLDGLASLRADYDGGEMVTRPLRFRGSRLVINFATSAAGDVRVEIQDAAGTPIPAHALADAREQIGNEIERVVTWKEGSDLAALAGRPIRLRFVMKDADLFAIRFVD